MAPRVIGEAAPGVHFADFADGAVGNPFADEAEALAAISLLKKGDFPDPAGTDSKMRPPYYLPGTLMAMGRARLSTLNAYLFYGIPGRTLPSNDK